MGSMLCICEKSACFFGYIQMIEICFGIQILAYWFICINFLVQRIDHCFDWWKMLVECFISKLYMYMCNVFFYMVWTMTEMLFKLYMYSF